MTRARSCVFSLWLLLLLLRHGHTRGPALQHVLRHQPVKDGGRELARRGAARRCQDRARCASRRRSGQRSSHRRRGWEGHAHGRLQRLRVAGRCCCCCARGGSKLCVRRRQARGQRAAAGGAPQRGARGGGGGCRAVPVRCGCSSGSGSCRPRARPAVERCGRRGGEGRSSSCLGLGGSLGAGSSVARRACGGPACQAGALAVEQQRQRRRMQRQRRQLHLPSRAARSGGLQRLRGGRCGLLGRLGAARSLFLHAGGARVLRARRLPPRVLRVQLRLARVVLALWYDRKRNRVRPKRMAPARTPPHRAAPGPRALKALSGSKREHCAAAASPRQRRLRRKRPAGAPCERTLWQKRAVPKGISTSCALRSGESSARRCQLWQTGRAVVRWARTRDAGRTGGSAAGTAALGPGAAAPRSRAPGTATARSGWRGAARPRPPAPQPARWASPRESRHRLPRRCRRRRSRQRRRQPPCPRAPTLRRPPWRLCAAERPTQSPCGVSRRPQRRTWMAPQRRGQRPAGTRRRRSAPSAARRSRRGGDRRGAPVGAAASGCPALRRRAGPRGAVSPARGAQAGGAAPLHGPKSAAQRRLGASEGCSGTQAH